MKTSNRFQRVVSAALCSLALSLVVVIIVPAVIAQGNPPRLTPYTITTAAGGATAPTQGTGGYSGGTVCGLPWQPEHTGLGPIWPTAPFDFLGDGCLANQAILNAPRYAIPDPFGTLWILDTGDGAYVDVRWVNPLTGIITAFNFGSTVNDNSPRGIAFDLAGNAYYMGENKSKGWKIDYISGSLSQFAGNTSGGSGCSGDDVPALGDGIDNPSGVAVDSLGNIYFADNKCFRVRRIDTTGMMWEVIGVGAGVCTSTGIAGTTGLNTPYAVAVDPYGNLYVANQTCYTLLEVLVDPTTVNANGVGWTTKNSQVVVLAGAGINPSGFTYPQFCFGNEPCGLGAIMPIEPNGVQIDPEGPVTDSSGNPGYNLFVQEGSHVWYYDFATKWIRRIAGGNTNCSWATDPTGDGCPATNSNMATAYGIDVDALGNLYVGDDGDNVIRKIFKGTQLTDGSALWLTAPYVSEYGTGSFEGTGVAAAHFDPVDSAAATNPFQVFGDFSVPPLVIDMSGFPQASPDCMQNTAADGSWDCLFSINFNATRPGTVTAPLDVTGTAAGSIKGYSLTGTVNYPAIALDPGVVTVLSSSVSNPGGVAVDSLGNWYVADTGNNQILKNGLVLVGGLNAPQGVAVDGPGNVYIADTGNNLVKEWNALTGAVTTVAGGGTPCSVASLVTFSSDSLGNNCLATQATLNHPTALAVDALLNLYILDQGNAEIRRVDPRKKAITLVAGGGGAGIPECSGGSTHPRCATLVSPVALAVGAPGLVFVVEGGSSNDIKEINLLTFPATISQVAISSSFTNPSGVGVDAAGNIYYADAGNQVVGMVNAPTFGTGQLVLGIAGTTGDTAIASGTIANTVALNGPAALAVDASGNVYVADVSNGRILNVGRSQSAIQFGQVAYGTATLSSGVTATNIGTQPLVFLPLSVSGTNAGDFSIFPATNACSTTPLASGASCNVVPLVQPVDVGSLSAAVVLSGNAMNTPVIQLDASSVATPTLTLYCTEVTYTGYGHSCWGTATGVGGAAVNGWFSNFSPASETNAGSYLVTGTFSSEDPNYVSGGTAVATLTIDPLPPTLTLTCPSVTYDGNPHACSGTAIGVGAGGVTVNGSWSFSPASETNAGSYAEIGTFTTSDTNFVSGGTAGGTLVIQPATPAVVVTCTAVTFDGNSHSCTATATGVGGAAVNGSFTFSPGNETAAGSYPETATFTSSDSNYTNGSGSGTLVIGAPPAGVAATLSTTALNFPGSMMVGQSAAAQYVLITSTGTTPLQVSGVTIGGANPGDFAVSNQAGTCTTGATLTNHAECNLRVIFTPTAIGPRSAILSIYDDLAGAPQQVTLSGTAISGAVVSLSATTLTFPATKVGATAAAQYITLKSTGFQPVVINQVVLSSGDFDLSDQAGTCTTAATTSLVPGASCNIRVKFHPTATGARTATVVINDNTATSPHTVTLNGTGQ
jgi:hypothetical protein